MNNKLQISDIGILYKHKYLLTQYSFWLLIIEIFLLLMEILWPDPNISTFNISTFIIAQYTLNMHFVEEISVALKVVLQVHLIGTSTMAQHSLKSIYPY